MWSFFPADPFRKLTGWSVSEFRLFQTAWRMMTGLLTDEQMELVGLATDFRFEVGVSVIEILGPRRGDGKLMVSELLSL
jgi:hypothetical protein